MPKGTFLPHRSGRATGRRCFSLPFLPSHLEAILNSQGAALRSRKPGARQASGLQSTRAPLLVSIIHHIDRLLHHPRKPTERHANLTIYLPWLHIVTVGILVPLATGLVARSSRATLSQKHAFFWHSVQSRLLLLMLASLSQVTIKFEACCPQYSRQENRVMAYCLSMTMCACNRER